MTTRQAYTERLCRLQDDVLAMGDVASRALERAVRSMVDRDADTAHEVISSDDALNDQYARVEQDVLELIATQQPMARDLREILALSSVATDLERIGDHAKGIARVSLRTLDEPVSHAPLALISRMSELVRDLLAAELSALVKRDADAARELAARDSEVDRVYDRIYRDVVHMMMEQPRSIPRLERVIWCAKSLERVGDHVTNIGERIVFLCTGEIVELNP